MDYAAPQPLCRVLGSDPRIMVRRVADHADPSTNSTPSPMT
jgi:hypothetical protein